MAQAACLAQSERARRTPVLRSALELRYQVYCRECGFLSQEDYPDGIETDEHDKDATHFYAFDSHGELAGYVRLVCANADQSFPFQEHCATPFEGMDLPPASQAAEISRLMVRNNYRRRRGDGLSGATSSENVARIAGDRRHAAPQILLDLYRQMYAYSCENGIRFWYAAMERPLARSMMRMNVAFTPIGLQTDYYGPVTPYLTDLQNVESVLANMALRIADRRRALRPWLQQPVRVQQKSALGAA